jgi:type II secretory pathway predicted ATPase ExeA/predicted XRE-type DNA-binding protein
MLSDVMEHFGLSKTFTQVEGFETDHHRQLLKDLKIAIHEGGIIALTGMLGSGKTVFLARLQDQLRHEGQMAVAESLSFTVTRVTLDTLKLALYSDLATDKDGELPIKTEKSERALIRVMRRCQKPIVLFVDDGHDLHGHTLRGLKQMIEKTRRRGARLTIVLAGHPRLKNDLRRPSQEETGARATVFEFEGIQGHQRRFITWLMEQCAPNVSPSDIVAPDALDVLVERLVTPLQIQHYLPRMLEQSYRFGEKPVTATVVNSTLAPDMHALEPTLTRHGYNVKALSELLHIRQPEVRSFLRGQLATGRTEELHNQLLAAGIPVNDGSSPPNPDAINA